MERLMRQVPQRESSGSPATTVRKVKTFEKHKLTHEKFISCWSSRQPVVVTGLHRELQCHWSPEFFIQEFSQSRCEVHDCESGEDVAYTVADFFFLFNEDSPRRIVKLKDWPPQDRFKTMFPQLYEDFENVVPMRQYTSAIGSLNLATHFPTNSVVPDLGPKMYNALSSILDDTHSGSTRLHLDLSDAVNILTYASTARDGSAGYALWHIFASEDTDKIHEYLNNRHCASRPPAGDPIHNQTTYLTPSMLEELDRIYSVRPYAIKQYLGHAVFISAGCTHQVSNQAHCIKIASDFVSPQSVDICKRLSSEFRIQRLARQWPPDVIPITHMLYYTWVSMAFVRGPETSLQVIKRFVPLQNNRSSGKRRSLASSAGLLNQRYLEKPLAQLKPFHCPLCLRSILYDAVAKFQYSYGVIDHVVQFHQFDLSKKEKKRCHGLDPQPLARRILKLYSECSKKREA